MLFVQVRRSHTLYEDDKPNTLLCTYAHDRLDTENQHATLIADSIKTTRAACIQHYRRHCVYTQELQQHCVYTETVAKGMHQVQDAHTPGCAVALWWPDPPPSEQVHRQSLHWRSPWPDAPRKDQSFRLLSELYLALIETCGSA